MTAEKFIEIMENGDVDISGIEDNAFEGLCIMHKYVHNLIQGANHDIIYGPNIEELIEAGITEEDVATIRKLNWMVEDESYVSCFV